MEKAGENSEFDRAADILPKLEEQFELLITTLKQTGLI